MKYINKLNELMKENPEIEVIFMYPEEGSDHYFRI